MSWLSAFPFPQSMLRIFAVVVTITSLPLSAYAQNATKRSRTDDKVGPVTICAEQMKGLINRDIHLDREVELNRDEITVHADKATFRQVENEIDAVGNVRIKRFGDRYTGNSLNLNLDSNEGSIFNPTYHIEKTNGQGKAERVDFQGDTQATVVNGTYSTCEGLDPDWYLKTDTLKLDTDRNIGTSSKTVVYFKGVPILGMPWLSFSLGGRKSGWLPPTFELGSKGHQSFTMPYYFNIAPNRDLTLYPKYIALRGLQLGANGRYLGESYSGQTNVEVLIDDKKTRTNRYALQSSHSQMLAPRWSYAWNVKTASDDEYPSDFSKSITASSERQLLRELRTDYSAAHWSATARVQNYLVLQDPDPKLRLDRPYDRLPQLTFRHWRYDVRGFDWAVDSDATWFWHPDKVRGSRIVVNPQISYPMVRSSYFVTPKLSLHATNYRLDNQTAGSQTLSRALPTLSVDSGLFFERDSQFFGKKMTQTLEPRLFYVNTPYRDQSMFPNFDTAEAGFNFAQIFNENRFTGSDRINDANQLTAALVSRYIEPSGAERLRLAFGQRFYFKEQRVVLNTAGPKANLSRSDLLLSASGRLTSSLSIDTAMQYSESARRVYSANYGAQWQPSPERVLNAEYRYLRNDVEQLKQVNVSAQWPLARRLYGMGRINYSLQDRKVVDSLVGLVYKADCWLLRFSAQRFVTTSQQSSTPIFLQLELNGLSKIGLGTNPLEALSRSVRR